MAKKLIDKRYEVLRSLGRGGMGEVLKVLDRVTSTTLALKIAPENATKKELLSFRNEFQTLAGLSHPNISKVYDFGTTADGRSYFTMEYVDGKDICTAFGKSRPLSNAQYKLLYSLLSQTCEALRLVHFRGLVHGDIKPDNILIEKLSATVKLMDFGLVEGIDPSEASKLRGTLDYIAPELLSGEKVDRRADLFSLGVTLYELLTGKMPFKAENPVSLLKQYREKTIVPPKKLSSGIPPKLNELVLRLLEVDPSKRTASVDEVLDTIAIISGKKSILPLFSSPFIGRVKELKTLKKRYKEVAQGAGRAILLLGEEGIGKTRLVQEFKVCAELEGATFREIAFSSDRGKGIQPFLNLFSEAKQKEKPDVSDKLVLFENTVRTIIRGTAKRPLFLLVEDIHLSAKIGIEFIRYLIRSIHQAPILIVVTSSDRPSSLEFAQDLNDARHFEKLKLRSFTSHQAFSQVKSMLGTESDVREAASLVFDKTEGNPFLVQGFVQTLIENLYLQKTNDKWELDVPKAKKVQALKGAEQFVQASLKSLTKEELRVLEAGAVLGSDFDVDTLKEVANISMNTLSNALTRFVQRDLVREVPGNRYGFAHTIIANSVESGIPQLRAQKLHKKAAQVIEKRFANDLDSVAENLTRHYIGCKQSKDAYRFATIAGEKAKKAYANDEAIRYLETALSLVDKSGTKKDKTKLLEAMGELHHIMGKSTEAISCYQDALALEQHARIYRKIGEIHRDQGEHEQSLRFLQKGLGAVSPRDISERIVLLTRIAWISERLGRHDEALAYSLQATELAKNEDEQVGLAQALSSIGLLYYRNSEWGKATECYEGVARIAKKHRNEAYLVSSSCSLGLIHLRKGEFQKADKHYQRSLDIAERRGDVYRTVDNYSALGVLAQETNRLDLAFNYHSRALDVSRRISHSGAIARCHVNLGLVYRDTGKWTEALQNYENGLAIYKQIGEDSSIAACYLNLGDLCRLKGEHDKALEYLKRSLRVSRRIDDRERIAHGYRAIGEVLQDKGEWNNSLRPLGKSINMYQKMELKKDEAETTRILSKSYVYTGDLNLARSCCEKAIMLCEKLNDKRLLGLAYRTLGTVHCKSNETKQSVATFATSIDELRKTDVPFDLGKTLLVAAEETFRMGMRNPDFSKEFWMDGHLDESLKRLKEAEKIFEKLGARGELEKIRELTEEIRSHSFLLLETIPGEDNKLRTLYRISQIINSVTDIDELLSRILDLTIQVIGAERGFILYKESDENLEVRSARNMDGQSIEDMSDFSRSIVNKATFKGELILTSDATDDSRFKDKRSIADFKLLSILCVPLKIKDDAVGAIYVDDRRKEKAFTENDLEFLKSFANQAGTAIENARLVEELKEANRGLEKENVYLKQAVESRYTFDRIVGKSEAMQEIYKLLDKIVAYDSSVLIEGETGTGKELVAHAIHHNGPRKDRRFVAVNCSALPDHLLESELFGHEKGAFSGAIRDKKGLFEVADKGTIFLDEIGELSQGLQAKLLRVLQNGELRKVGSTKCKKVDVRLLTATGKNLEEEVEKGKFRSDLFYRLNVISIKMPPLRERKEDIPLLADHFLSKFKESTGKNIKGLAAEALHCLLNCKWEGNVRQLENTIERAVVLASGPTITMADLPAGIVKKKVSTKKKSGKETTSLSDLEKGHIEEVLDTVEWNKSKTARILAISRPALDRKLRKYNLG